MNSIKNTARLAGLLWLLSVVAGGFGLMYMRSKVIVPGDAGATAANLMASEFLFRTAVVGTLLGQVFLFFLALTFFQLFKEVNRRLATVLLASALITVALAVINTLNHFGALMLLGQANVFAAFTSEQRNTIAFFLLRLANGPGQGIIEIFWVPYYFSLGLLTIRSGWFPKVLGILLTMMGVGFAINILDKFLIPQFHPVAFTRLAMGSGALGGLPTMLWLLIKGAKVESLSEQT